MNVHQVLNKVTWDAFKKRHPNLMTHEADMTDGYFPAFLRCLTKKVEPNVGMNIFVTDHGEGQFEVFATKDGDKESTPHRRMGRTPSSSLGQGSKYLSLARGFLVSSNPG